MGDTVNFPGGWGALRRDVRCDSVLAQRRGDVNDLRVELSRMDAELNDIIENRDAGEPKLQRRCGQPERFDLLVSP